MIVCTRFGPMGAASLALLLFTGCTLPNVPEGPSSLARPLPNLRFALSPQPSREYLIWDMHPVSSAALQPIIARQLRMAQFVETNRDHAEILVAIQVFTKDGKAPVRTCTLVVELLEPRSGAPIWLGQTEMLNPEMAGPEAWGIAEAQIGIFLRAMPWSRAFYTRSIN